MRQQEKFKISSFFNWDYSQKNQNIAYFINSIPKKYCAYFFHIIFGESIRQDIKFWLFKNQPFCLDDEDLYNNFLSMAHEICSKFSYNHGSASFKTYIKNSIKFFVFSEFKKLQKKQLKFETSFYRQLEHEEFIDKSSLQQINRTIALLDKKLFLSFLNKKNPELLKKLSLVLDENKRRFMSAQLQNKIIQSFKNKFNYFYNEK